jgi:hypothetical protein
MHLPDPIMAPVDLERDQPGEPPIRLDVDVPACAIAIPGPGSIAKHITIG